MTRKLPRLVWLVTVMMSLSLAVACGGGGGNEDGNEGGQQTNATPTPTTAGQPNGDGGSTGDTAYYKGKSIRIIIPYSAGGSSAVLVPYFTQELPKFIDGNPRMTSTHMTPIIAAYNFLTDAPNDGSEVMYSSAAPFSQQFTPDAQFDVAAFEYIGSYTSGESVLFVTNQVPFDDFLSMQGASDFTLRLPITTDPSELSADDLGTLIAAEAFNVPLRLIPLSGASTGTPELLVAMERGDIHGQSAAAVYYTLTNLRPGWTRDGIIKPFAFFGRPNLKMEPNSESDATAPNLTDAILNADIDQSVKDQWRAFVVPGVALGKHFLVPPDTNSDAVNALRVGLERAMNDATFVEGLERLLGQESVFLNGEEFQDLLESSAASFRAQHDQFDPLVRRLYDKYTQ